MVKIATPLNQWVAAAAFDLDEAVGPALPDVLLPVLFEDEAATFVGLAIASIVVNVVQADVAGAG
jgi:hypothetical protein